ncbi:MAG: nitrogen fixation protein NifH [Methanomicrobia archaeon]|nr:nitrogen fixation protein NifH [Methanomicrobia archaeon]
MSDWKSLLKVDPTDWLLEEENPSVRYFTLTDIMEKSSSDPDIQKTKRTIMVEGVVPEILAIQHKDGYWEDSKRFYTAKYKGTVWQLIILAELGAEGNDERIKKTCEFILEISQDRESDGFSMHSSAKDGGRHSEVIPCLTGNMVWALIRFSCFHDPRLQKGIGWITQYFRADDGEGDPQGWPYERSEFCRGKHTCFMSVVKMLKALAEIPSEKRSKEVKKTIKMGCEFMLKHHIHKRSHNLEKVSKPSWRKFGFPLMYQTDALEILDILTKLGYKDKRMQEAIDLVLSKQNNQGRWNLEKTFNGKFQIDIEEKGKESKWITLNAIRVLKRFYS